MSLLIVDDMLESRLLLSSLLRSADYKDLRLATSAEDALRLLQQEAADGIELILLDIVMPGLNGIDACRRIRGIKRYRDIPILMVSAREEMSTLQAAFDAGAIDFITKPIDRIELLARVGSALRLKRETDTRKLREAELVNVSRQLVEANRRCRELATRDGLTGIFNRRSFDEQLSQEWRRTLRCQQPLSLLMIDIDYFKHYNDSQGHLAGDQCLKQVAQVLTGALRRASDYLARFGGEEFVALLPNTDLSGAVQVATQQQAALAALELPHPDSPFDRLLTLSIGAAWILPRQESLPEELVNAADRALYRAKQNGRNRIETYEEPIPSANPVEFMI